MTEKTSNPSRSLKIISLAAVIFLTVSGGPYGLEPLIQYAGANGALLLLVLVPLLCDFPSILMVLELNSMMPVNGGYYKWVNRAMGRRWAFFEGWWTWLYSFTDLAIYPVMFVTYAGFFFPAIQEYRTPLLLILIWGSAGLNILGIVPVGRVSMFLGTVIIIPFLILFGSAFTNPSMHLTIPSPSLNGIGFSAFGMALYTVLWNFLGWDNTTTYAGEVDRPVRSYIITMFMASALVIVLYLITTVITLNSGVDFTKLSDGGYPMVGVKLAGRWLGILISIGGMASTMGIFSAVMLSISRIPKAMADDKLLSNWFAKEHKRFNTPYISILVSATVVSFMTLWGFAELVIIDVILYGAGLFLEFISLIILRVKEPDTHRPFRVPLNTFLLSILMLLPIAIYITAMIGIMQKDDGTNSSVYFALGALLTAPVAWLVIRQGKEILPLKETTMQE